MAYDPTNLHAMILRGELERARLVENQHVLAFEHPCPRAETHVVLLCKGEFESVQEFSMVAPVPTVLGFWRSLAEVARKLGLEEGNYRLVIDATDEAEAPHFHVHLLAGEAVDSSGRIDPDELVLMLLPVDGDPTDEQLAALTSALELSDYDARRCLGSGLPWALRKGSPSLVKGWVSELREALPLGCVQTFRLAGDLEPWGVEWLEVADEGLVMVGVEGREPLALGDGGLLVRGRYRSVGAESRFAHLYVPGNPRPFAFVESQLRDYAFLREDMAPSAKANYQLLMDILADQPRVTVQDAMLEADPAKVSAAVAAIRRDVTLPATSSPDVNAELLSRLIHYSVF